MDIAVTPFDASNERAAHDALAVQAACVAHDLPDFPAMCPVNFIAGLSHPWPGDRPEHAVAYLDGEPVAHAVVGLPQLENLENANLELSVLPAYRRRGVGGVLYRWAEELARANGRKKMLAVAVGTLPDGPERDSAGARFLAARGFKPALGEVRRRLDVTKLDQPALDRMLADGWAKADGYRLVRWIDLAPEELLDDVAYLDGRLLLDAPMGDLDWEPPKTDADRVRKGQAAITARGRTQYHSGAVHEETGRLVAWTTLDIGATSKWHSFQNITIVEPRHRGHRLGAIVKVENLRWFLAEQPQITTIDTWNAAVNDHMISINEAMGFRPVDAWTDYQVSF
jgi:GNAT superfamily N-acetyltransferase